MNIKSLEGQNINHRFFIGHIADRPGQYKLIDSVNDIEYGRTPLPDDRVIRHDINTDLWYRLNNNCKEFVGVEAPQIFDQTREFRKVHLLKEAGWLETVVDFATSSDTVKAVLGAVAGYVFNHRDLIMNGLNSAGGAAAAAAALAAAHENRNRRA